MRKNDSRRNHTLIPVLILVLFLVLSISIVSMILFKTISLNRLSETQNMLVQLGRNTAEEYRAGLISSENGKLFYDEMFRTVGEAQAEFVVQIVENRSMQSHGIMKTGIITVTSQNEQGSYTLTVQVYCPNGGTQ